MLSGKAKNRLIEEGVLPGSLVWATAEQAEVLARELAAAGQTAQEFAECRGSLERGEDCAEIEETLA